MARGKDCINLVIGDGLTIEAPQTNRRTVQEIGGYTAGKTANGEVAELVDAKDNKDYRQHYRHAIKWSN